MKIFAVFSMLCCIFLSQVPVYGDEKKVVSTPRFLFDIPANRVCLVAIDRDPDANRKFANKENTTQEVKGVDPVLGEFFVKPAEVFVTLEYPMKRESPQDGAPMWNVSTGWTVTEKKSLSSKDDLVSIEGDLTTTLWMSLGHNFRMASREQQIAYHENGRINWGYEIQILESPVKPKVEEVDTGIPGVELFQITYGKVGDKEHSVIVLISESLELAESAISVSDENPKFQWTKKWFGDTPPSVESSD